MWAASCASRGSVIAERDRGCRDLICNLRKSRAVLSCPIPSCYKRKTRVIKKGAQLGLRELDQEENNREKWRGQGGEEDHLRDKRVPIRSLSHLLNTKLGFGRK
ncbi:hypothetical protein ACOSP7_019203 [Xanthoceras sorbifolium]